MDGRVLREIHSLRIVAGHDDFDLEAFCEKLRSGIPEALVSAVVGTIDASDAAAFFRSTSASGAKKVLTLVWSMAWNAGGVAFLRNLAISISRSCRERRFRSLYWRLRISFRVNGGFMMTRSNSPVSDLLGAAPGSARSASSSPVVGRGTMKLRQVALVPSRSQEFQRSGPRPAIGLRAVLHGE